MSANLLYFGNSSTLKIINANKDFGNSNEVVIEPAPEDILIYEIKGGKLHGFVENSFSINEQYLICMIETSDAQINFARLYFWSKDIKKADIEFFEYREVSQRKLPQPDAIKKIAQVILSNEFQFGAVLRTSGRVDIYWNFTLVQSITEYQTNNVVHDDVSANYTSLFLKQTQKDKSQQIHEMPLKWDSRIGMDIAETYHYNDQTWDSIKFMLIKEKARIFSAMTLVDTTFFFSFNNIVSNFDIIRKLWLQHYILEEEVVELLRNRKQDESGKDIFFIGILLKSGKIIPIESNEQDDGNYEWIISEDKKDIGGSFKRLISDTRDFASQYIILENSKGKSIQLYQDSNLVDLSSSAPVTGNKFVVKFLSEDKEEDFAVVDPDKQSITIYRNSTYGVYTGKEIDLKCSANSNQLSLNNDIHTVVFANFAGEYDNLLFFDSNSIQIFNLEKKICVTLNDMCVKSVNFIDKKYIYCLQNESIKKDLQGGVYFYDINELATKKEDGVNFRIKKAIVGKSTLFDYYRDDERFAYLESFERFKIVPLLHRNTINFIGMQKRDNYVGFKKDLDILIALDKHNRLTTWSACTGKVKSQFKLKVPVIDPSFRVFSIDEFDITYKADFYMPRILFFNDQQEEQVDEKEYFADRLYLSLPNNTSYISMEAKTFRKFKLIEIMSSTEVKEHLSFVHPFYGAGVYQKIYFSQDLNYMLERIINQRVFLYKRENKPDGTVKWNLIRRLRQFPLDMSECTYFNYLFSPDLMYYLDYSKSENSFLIKRSQDQGVRCTIPQGYMNPANEEPTKICKRFRWVDSNTIKLINIEGIEKIINIEHGFKEINEDTVPMINVTNLDKDNYHYYFAPVPMEVGDTYQRLRKKYQKYNSLTCLENIQDPQRIYDVLFQVDFSLEGFKGKLVLDISFDYIHWKMAEILSVENPKYKISRFGIDDLKQLTLNIFPKGNTFLHYSYHHLTNIRKVYDIVNAYNKSLEAGSIKYEIPFIRNFDMQSPIHLSINENNYKAADVFLTYLADTPLDSHSRVIVNIIPKIISNNLPSFGTYMEKRMLQTQQLKIRCEKRGSIKKQDEDADYAVAAIELWCDIDKVNKLIFTDETREADVKLVYLDIPYVHSYSNEVGDEFFNALADADIDIFNYKSIQALIDYKWPLAREYTIKMLFIPFFVFHINFIIYSNVFNGQYAYTDNSWYIGHDVLAALNYAFSLYFLQNEMRQLVSSGWDYFSQFWNYIDFFPPIIIIIVTSLKLNIYYNPEYQGTYFLYTLHAVACMCMWLKLLYFLRIFKQTSYLVRTLTDVIWEMKTFLFILFVVYFAFGDAFLRFSQASDPNVQFINNFPMAWVLSFSNQIDNSQFNLCVQNIALWIFWVIYGVITAIIMLNLLISIISDAFVTINGKAILANYQERARIIAENGYLIPKHIKKNLADHDKYLIIGTEISEAEEDEKKIGNLVQDVDDLIKKIKGELEDKHKTLEDKLDSLFQN